MKINFANLNFLNHFTHHKRALMFFNLIANYYIKLVIYLYFLLTFFWIFVCIYNLKFHYRLQ